MEECCSFNRNLITLWQTSLCNAGDYALVMGESLTRAVLYPVPLSVNTFHVVTWNASLKSGFDFRKLGSGGGGAAVSLSEV